jgi:ferredoxin-type protein NapH
MIDLVWGKKKMADNKNFFAKRTAQQLIMSVLFFIVLIGGWFFPVLGYFIPACMLLGMGIGFFKGRKWCDWYCPRGSFYDVIVVRLSPNRQIPEFFKSMLFRWILLSILMLIMATQIVLRWPDPLKIGKFFVIMMTTTTILGVLLAVIFASRTWCSFCPIGTIVNATSRKVYPLSIDDKLCVDCKLCAKACPMQIKPYIYRKSTKGIIGGGDCLKCSSCVNVCPKKALKL